MDYTMAIDVLLRINSKNADLYINYITKLRGKNAHCYFIRNFHTSIVYIKEKRILRLIQYLPFRVFRGKLHFQKVHEYS